MFSPSQPDGGWGDGSLVGWPDGMVVVKAAVVVVVVGAGVGEDEGLH